MNIKTNILLRIYIVGILCAVFGFVVMGRVYQIQTENNGYWRNIADTLTTKIFTIPADRGNIYSAENELLATTVPYFNLFIDFGSTAMSDEIFKANIDSLAYYMSVTKKDKPVQQYKKELTTARKLKRRYYPIFKNIEFVQLNKIKQWPLFREGKYSGGLIVETLQKRHNPFGYIAGRTIGYIKKDGPSVGLEGTYNAYLAGVSGIMPKQRIAGGTWMPIHRAGSIEPQNGKDIHTTIDISVQDIAETTLMDAVINYNADFGCAVVMEVKTGAIKAIANLGKNKNNTYSETYNYAVGMGNEPGSVFKLAGYLALFDDGYITLNDSINTNHASATFGKFRLTDDGHNTQYQYLKPDKAMAISSNVAIAKWVTQFYGGNKKKYYSKLAQFGLTTKTKIELSGEPTPYINTPDKWSGMSLPWMAHGYEVKLTPLQILAFYNAVANGGIRTQPHLVNYISEGNNIIKSFEYNDGQRICSKEAALFATEILKAVVNDQSGTGRNIRTPYYQIAGKTGTAKISFGKEGYTNKNLSTFVGFFPADNPLYSCIVVMGNPQGLVTTGGYVAAPVFRTIADKIISSNVKNNLAVNKDTSLKSINPPTFVANTQQIKSIAKLYDVKVDANHLDAEYAYVDIDPSNKKVKVRTIKNEPTIIPNVRGMLLDDAIYLLENMGFKVGFTGKGKVQTQSIESGQNFMKGTYIHLTLN